MFPKKYLYRLHPGKKTNYQNQSTYLYFGKNNAIYQWFFYQNKNIQFIGATLSQTVVLSLTQYPDLN